MAISLNTGSATINGAVVVNNSINLPGAGQTVINQYGQGNGAVQSLYTVPAGKTFYLFGAQGAAGPSNANYWFYKNDGATIVLFINTAPNISQAITCVAPIFKYAAGEVVKTKATNGYEYNFWGIEA